MLWPSIRTTFQRWLFRVGGPEPTPIRLGQRRIFVLPSRFGMTLGLTLLVMLLASINYALSLGFALTFLIGSVAWVSIHHAFRNLVELSIAPGRAEPVFCGSPARFGVLLHNTTLRPRRGLQLWPAGAAHTARGAPFDIPTDAISAQEVAIDTQTRGWLQLPRLTLETRHPLGLIRAWSLFQPDLRCLVYPTPEAKAPPLPVGDDERPGDLGRSTGNEDFAGLRHHQPADSPRHIAWKAVARGGPWRTKEFDGAGARSVQLDWNQLPARLGTEERLSRLTRWLIDADEAGLEFGLRVPGADFPPARGHAHRHACLATLALFGQAHD
jgi:uncharacterized protein (DUF58 family)